METLCSLDGRYQKSVAELLQYFSGQSFNFTRAYFMEQWLLYLAELFPHLSLIRRIEPLVRPEIRDRILKMIDEHEKKTNHDVKAIEYTICDLYREYLQNQNADEQTVTNILNMIHFGLTSNDVNSITYAYLTKKFFDEQYVPMVQKIIETLTVFASQNHTVMLSFTHGQPATPTTMHNQIMVFVERLENALEPHVFRCKYGGATGGMNAAKFAVPEINWLTTCDKFCAKFGLVRCKYTTQIDHYDYYGRLFDMCKRINTILKDLCQDVWAYISKGYLKLKVVKGETGSSTMPHKVNPIDFENAEGNLAVAESSFEMMARKLPVSRLQRDLTDSTVMRNVGMPFGYTFVAFKSILRGMSKVTVCTQKTREELDDMWEVLGEAVQTVLRLNGVPDPYEKIKAYTRNGEHTTVESYHSMIKDLHTNGMLTDDDYQRLKAVSPASYVPYMVTRPIMNTSNPDKQAEFRKMLGPEIEFTSVDIVEPNTDQSLIVAYKCGQLVQQFPGVPVMCEDTALTIIGKEDEIGVNVKWLLSNLHKYIGSEARFDCLIGYCDDGKTVKLYKGSVTGKIVSPRGEKGFGFDNVFEVNGKTLAEEKPDQHNARFLACEKLQHQTELLWVSIIFYWDGPFQENIY